MKKLAHLKPGSSTTADSSHGTSKKRNGYPSKSHSKKANFSKSNNPYPESTCITETLAPESVEQSSATLPNASASESSLEPGEPNRLSEDGMPPPTIGNKSTTVTSTGRACSEIAPSNTPSSGQMTSGTVGCGVGGDGSTFSSPSPSVRSLTTTLTTLHSIAPTSTTTNHTNNNHLSTHFTHQFPASSPLNALPPHMVPYSNGSHPSTYNSATANNLLTDNASILTLASSSKHGRRRSMDTDASVRALAPSSLFGGSRESLPLSVLSASIETSTHQQRPSIGGINERGSIYSTGGVSALALSTERNSCYAGKQPMTGDSANLGAGILQGSSLIISRELLRPGSGKLTPSETIRDQDTELENKQKTHLSKNNETSADK